MSRFKHSEYSFKGMKFGGGSIINQSSLSIIEQSSFINHQPSTNQCACNNYLLSSMRCDHYEPLAPPLMRLVSMIHSPQHHPSRERKEKAIIVRNPLLVLRTYIAIFMNSHTTPVRNSSPQNFFTITSLKLAKLDRLLNTDALEHRFFSSLIAKYKVPTSFVGEGGVIRRSVGHIMS